MEEFNNYSGMIALVIFLILFVLFVKYESNHQDEDEVQEEQIVNKENTTKPLNLDDEDATVACLIAAIEARNETHKNIHIISVREVK